MYLKTLLSISFVNVVVGRDFTLGMFKRNDLLVTQDIVFKERFPFSETSLKYGKTFACLVSITELSIIKLLVLLAVCLELLTLKPRSLKELY